MSRTWSLVTVVASAACFGTLAILTPLAYRTGAHPLPLLAWRFVIAAALLGAVATVRDRRALVVPLSDVGRFSLLAFTGYGAASICFFYALQFADASVVGVLLYAYPAMVTIVGWIAGTERATSSRAAAVGVTFAGCALVVGIGSNAVDVKWQGVALGLGAAVGYTIFNLLSHRWLPGRSRLTIMAYTFGIAAVLPAVGAVAAGGLDALSPAAWTGVTWGLLVAIVLVPTFAAILLYLEGIRGLGPAQAAVVSTFEPLFTIVLAAIVLHERLSALQGLGAVLVFAGVVWSELGARSASEPAPS